MTNELSGKWLDFGGAAGVLAPVSEHGPRQNAFGLGVAEADPREPEHGDRASRGAEEIYCNAAGPLEARTRIEQNLRIAALEREVRQLKNELAGLKEAARVPEVAKWPTADPCLLDVIAATEELFGVPEVCVSHDPEDPSNPFVVFTVKSKGDTATLLAKHIDWRDRLGNMQPGYSGMLRLSIIPEA